MTASSLHNTSLDDPTAQAAKIAQMQAHPTHSVSRPTQAKIKVTLLLGGGHQQTLFLERDSMLLKQLAFAMVARTQPERTMELIQIPVEDGRASLCFSTADLIGLVTDPPVMLQRTEQAPTQAQPQSQAGTMNPISTAFSTVAKDPSILTALKRPLQPTPKVAPGVLPSKYFLAEDFLSSQECQQLMDYVLERESHFVPASTTTGDEDYRQSLVLHQFPPFAEKFRKKIRQHLPELLPALDLDPFEASEIEAQLTAHNHGNYFKLHNDSGSPETATRVLTYVYYFYRQPKPFSGGELKIYDSKVENGFYVAADSARLIEPRNNSIIFFLSRYMHEVLTVSCPSQSFADSRFTVNGWVRR